MPIYPRPHTVGFDIYSGSYNRDLYEIIYRRSYPWYDILGLQQHRDCEAIMVKYAIDRRQILRGPWGWFLDVCMGYNKNYPQ